MRITNTILALFILFPSSILGQNIVTFVKFDKVTEGNPETGNDVYRISIRPGYHDKVFLFELVKTDSAGKETIISNPEISVKMNVWRNDYKTPDGKYEWDYRTEITGNDTYKDDYLEIGACTDAKHVVCKVTVKEKERYRIRVTNTYRVLEERELM